MIGCGSILGGSRHVRHGTAGVCSAARRGGGVFIRAARGAGAANHDTHHRLVQSQISRHRTEKIILAAFRQGLGQTGYVEGRNLTIELRFGDGQYDRLPALAADLVRRQVEVLVTTGGTNITRVAQAATTTIPIIFATASDPVQDGLVKSINRPGGNSTGTYVLNTALVPKRLEVLRQLVPERSLGRLPGEPERLEHRRPDTTSSIRSPHHGR